MSNVITILEGQLKLSLKAARREERKVIRECGSPSCAELGVCVAAYYGNHCKRGKE